MEWSHGGKGVPWRGNTEEFNALLENGWEIITIENSFTQTRHNNARTKCRLIDCNEWEKVVEHSTLERYLRMHDYPKKLPFGQNPPKDVAATATLMERVFSTSI